MADIKIPKPISVNYLLVGSVSALLSLATAIVGRLIFGNQFDPITILLSAVAGGTGTYIFELFRTRFITLYRNSYAIIQNQIYNNKRTQVNLKSNRTILSALLMDRSEIQNAYLSAIAEFSNEVKMHNNVLNFPSEWLALKVYKYLWTELSQIQEMLSKTSGRPRTVVWITHCGSIDILTSRNPDELPIDGSQKRFQGTNGIVARILVNQGINHYEEYEAAKKKMKDNGALVFYLENGASELDPDDTMSDFLTARIPKNKLGVPSGDLMLRWCFDAKRTHILRTEVSDDDEVAERTIERWDHMIKIVLRQELASEEPSRHLCTALPAQILAELPTDTRQLYREVVEAKNLPFAK